MSHAFSGLHVAERGRETQGSLIGKGGGNGDCGGEIGAHEFL